MESAEEGVDWHADGEDVPAWYLGLIAFAVVAIHPLVIALIWGWR